MTVATDSPASPTPAPKKKKSLVGLLFKIFGVLVILVIIGVVILLLNLNSLIKMGVERGGKQATLQDTLLNGADLSLSGGTLQLNGLGIANLAGYTSPNVLTMKSCSTTVQTSSLFTHTVIIDNITISGLELTLEQNGMKNNLNELMQAIQKNTAATGSAPTADGSTAPPGNTPPGKELKITTLKLTGTVVHLRVGAPLNFNQDINLPDLEMDEPTNPDGRPMKIADLVGKILLELGKQVVENPAIPGNIKDSMKNVTALVDNLRGQLDKGLKNLPNLQGIQDLGKNLDVKNLGDTGKQLQDAGKNLGNLFDKKK